MKEWFGALNPIAQVAVFLACCDAVFWAVAMIAWWCESMFGGGS